MDFDITFIPAEPESAWLADIVFEIIYKWPVELFGGKKPWDIIITRQPFVHEFVVLDAHKMLYSLRDEKSVPNQPIFPKDSLETDENLKQYLDKPPLRIILIGDEQPYFYEIGDCLSQKFRSPLVTPENLISREIKRNTQVGKWLNWNLNNDRGIPIFVVLKLLEAELSREKYKDRGFILTGFPIMPDQNTRYKTPCKFRNDEDYDIEPLCDYYERLGEFANEEAETATLMSVSSTCSSISTEVQEEYEEEDYFKTIRNQLFVYPDGEGNEVLKDCVRKQLDIIRHLWCQPEYIIFINSSTYSDQYVIVKDVVQRAVLFYQDQNVLRFDARMGPVAIIDAICLRFYYINYKVNYSAIRINTSESNQITLDSLCETGTILPNCKWWVSNFGKICPVTLYYGRRRFCDCKFPVQYLRYIFLCYSEKYRTKFVAHPRKYMNLMPTCRAAIIGPHRSGKTTLSKYFAQYFKADLYTDHIKAAEDKINAEYNTTIEKELKGFEALKTKNFAATKRTKIEEWYACVCVILNEMVIELTGDMFSIKNSENYFEQYYKSSSSDNVIKQLILENAIFNESVKSISPFDFMEWVSIKPKSHQIYRQFVIDCAPLDLDFWEELLISDALPGCVYLLKTTPLKLTDIYSLRHDETCIDHKMIYEIICEIYTEWEDLFEQMCPKHNANQLRMDDSTKEYLKYLIAARTKEAGIFMKKYDELKLFLKEHDVTCIEVDITKRTWSRSILKALYDHLFQYQAQPKLLNNVQSQTYGFGEYMNEEHGFSPSSSFYNDFTDRDRMNDSELSLSKTVSFGPFRDFCPVLLCDHNVLLKGNMQFTVEYKNKVYAMHSEQAMNDFYFDPIKYCQQKPVVPPARIFIVGLTHRNKLKMAENLANSFNVELDSYAWYNSLFGDDFSVKSARDTYLENKEDFLEDLKKKYKNGAVTFGYPLLLEQFEDAIAQNMYPECIFIFNDTDEILHTMTRYFERLTSMQYFASRVPVPDERFDFLCDYHKPVSKVPAYLNVVDIAGLVKGAAEGQGLGNAFLSHISACDSIFHLCRAFEDPDVTHVEGEVDPVRDLDIICEELRLKDEEKLIQNLDKLEKVVARGGDKKLKPEYDSLLKVKSVLVTEKKHLRFADWNAHDIETLNKYMFLTTKPMIYLVNLSDKDFIRKKNKWLAKIKEWVDKNDPGATIIPFSGHFEHDLAEKDESERKAYEEETKCKSVLDKIIVTGYKALQLEYFFTAGPDEVKAWTVQKGTKAPQAAGRIHTDFEKGFIMAEVMHFKDFKEEGSEAAAKAAGKYRQQGRNYIVEDGDIIFFKFNAGAGLKDAKKK